jgi:hypothetical protein
VDTKVGKIEFKQEMDVDAEARNVTTQIAQDLGQTYTGKLVANICDFLVESFNYATAFLYTYYSFLTPKELLDTLLDLYVTFVNAYIL